jgi:glycosyltransferase involved in cell wall biosynthesis
VTKNIFMPLFARGFLNPNDVFFWGVNYHGEPHNLPVKVWPAQIAASRDPDLYGRGRLLTEVLTRNKFGEIDMLFVLQDHFTVSSFPNGPQPHPFIPCLIDELRKKQGHLRVVQYVPVDGVTLYPEWVDWMVDRVDVPVAYTKFGRNVLLNYVPRLRDKLRVIPHGTNPEIFRPATEEERNDFRAKVYRCAPDRPVFVVVNRNQPRKDLARALVIHKQVLRKMPNALLYIHANVNDSAGLNLSAVAHSLRIPADSLRLAQFQEGQGVPIETLRMVYAASDVFYTTARGEGWGLTLTEAMSCGLPCVAPDHSSHTEILQDGRGILVPPDPWPSFQTLDHDQPRRLADVEAMASALVETYHNTAKRQELGKAARRWAEKHTWTDHVAPMWQDAFTPPAPVEPDKSAYRLPTS